MKPITMLAKAIMFGVMVFLVQGLGILCYAGITPPTAVQRGPVTAIERETRMEKPGDQRTTAAPALTATDREPAPAPKSSGGKGRAARRQARQEAKAAMAQRTAPLSQARAVLESDPPTLTPPRGGVYSLKVMASLMKLRAGLVRALDRLGIRAPSGKGAAYAGFILGLIGLIFVLTISLTPVGLVLCVLGFIFSLFGLDYGIGIAGLIISLVGLILGLVFVVTFA